MTAERHTRSRIRWAPYLHALPGSAWMILFFVIPMLYMLSVSLQQGNFIDGFRQTFHFQNYADMVTLYHTQLIRSLVYGAITTVVSIAIAYPMAYWIAFRGGVRKSVYLFLVLLPFFVTFVLRTISWKFLLSDNGILLGPLKSAGLLPSSFHVLATGFAVVAGLVYNFLPFMLLPIYVSLEQMNPALLEAADDLYANRYDAFRRVIFPLSMPGVFAGVLLTFVPASSDYINAGILGGTHQVMIGNIIQTLYITNGQYQDASALSFVLLAVLLIGVFIYAKVQGTEDVMNAAAG
jgi:spermidine/putrescine transport system permease protein